MNKTELVKSLKALRDAADDQTALKALILYADWATGKTVAVGDRRQHDGKLYKCRQAHTTQADWTPDATPALWEVIDPIHAGTLEDPIPYDQAMAVYKGKIYSYDGKLYECIRDSGNPLYAEPGALLGNYFNLIEEGAK